MFSPISPRYDQSRSPVPRSAQHPIGCRGEAQSAQHINGHHGITADDATATSRSQSAAAAASPAPRAACTQSATAAATSAATAAHSESAHGAFSAAQHGKFYLNFPAAQDTILNLNSRYPTEKKCNK